MDIMTKEESYADRRQLFKNIWEAAMQLDEKDVENVTVKPKVIKTLRLEEVDKCVDKRKKERIKNLRTVCKKILDFCDRQEANDMNEQNADSQERIHRKLELKRTKTRHKRRKVKRNSSLEALKNSSAFEKGKSNDFPRIFPKNTSRYNSPAPMKTTFVHRSLVTHRRISKVKSTSDAEENNPLGKSATRRKVVRKRISKRKKSTVPNLSPPGPSGTLDCPNP